jgi:hypothetical protein
MLPSLDNVDIPFQDSNKIQITSAIFLKILASFRMTITVVITCLGLNYVLYVDVVLMK